MLVLLLVVVVVGLPICTHILNEPYGGVQSSSTSTYQSNNNINYQSVTPTSKQSNTNIEKVPIFHWQENIYPRSYWSIPVQMRYKERLEIKYICYSTTKSMWMDSTNFKLFKNGYGYRCYTLDPNGSDEWRYIEAEYQDTWYLVFNNDTDHIKVVNVELRK